MTTDHLEADLPGDAEIREIKADIAKMNARRDALQKDQDGLETQLLLASKPLTLTSTSISDSDDVVLENRSSVSNRRTQPSVQHQPHTAILGFMTVEKRRALPPGSSAEHSKVDARQNGCKGSIVKGEGHGLGPPDPHPTTVTDYKQGR